MCIGERTHRREIALYLRATALLQPGARCAPAPSMDPGERRASGLVALWNLLVEKLESVEHDTWCALLRGPVAELDRALRPLLFYRWLDEIRRSTGSRRMGIDEGDAGQAGESAAAESWTVAATRLEVVLGRRSEVGWLRKALAQLPEKERIAIEGSDLAERTFAELGASLGVAESTVRGWRESGLRRLREAGKGR